MYFLRRAALLAVLLLVPIAAHANAGAPLEETEVRRFLATLAELEQLQERFDDTDFSDVETGPDAGFSPLTASLDEIRMHEAYPEFLDVLRRHDFADEDRWAEVGDRTFTAYMALEMYEENPNMMAELNETLAEIEQNPDITDEQRAMITRSMGPLLSIIKSVEAVPEDDLEIARALRPEIDAVIQP